MCFLLPLWSIAELYDRELTKQSKRISNPGCYATNTQLLLAPLMPYLDGSNAPTIFGVSGYSGAGTKSGENDSDGRPKTVPKVVSRLSLVYLMARSDPEFIAHLNTGTSRFSRWYPTLRTYRPHPRTRIPNPPLSPPSLLLLFPPILTKFHSIRRTLVLRNHLRLKRPPVQKHESVRSY